MSAFHIIVLAATLVAVVLGGRWLFRQRSPDEIIVAREKLGALKRK